MHKRRRQRASVLSIHGKAVNLHRAVLPWFAMQDFTYHKRAKYFTPLLAITFLLVSTALAYVFLIVPNERTMGPVQRIFYFHVGCAIATYAAIASMFLSAVLMLRWPSTRQWADALNEAAAEVALVFATIVMLTGMIWGNAAWNTPFQWEPRLVSFMILCLILLGLNLLRWFSGTSSVASQSAVLSILATVTIPLVVFSVNLLPQSAQLHPQVLINDGLRHPSYKWAFSCAAFGLISLQFVLLTLRYRLGRLRRTFNKEIEWN